jgi:hypothetical protein
MQDLFETRRLLNVHLPPEVCDVLLPPFLIQHPGQEAGLGPNSEIFFYKMKNISILVSHAIQEACLGPNPENTYCMKR